MARRKSRKKSPARRRTQTINVMGIAEGALIANAMTQGLFNADLKTFFLSTDGGGHISSISGRSTITLREIISGVTGGSYGTQGTFTTTLPTGATVKGTYGQSFGKQVKDNFSENGLQMVGSLIAIPIAFKVGSKLARKPRALVNKVGKMSGLPVRV